MGKKYLTQNLTQKVNPEGPQLMLGLSLMIDWSSNVCGEMNNVTKDGFPGFKVT